MIHTHLLDIQAIDPDKLLVGYEMDAAVAIHVYGRTDRYPGNCPMGSDRGGGRVPGSGVYISDNCFSTSNHDAIDMLGGYAAKGLPVSYEHDPSSKLPHGVLVGNFTAPEWGLGMSFAEAACRGALLYEKGLEATAVKAR